MVFSLSLSLSLSLSFSFTLTFSLFLSLSLSLSLFLPDDFNFFATPDQYVLYIIISYKQTYSVCLLYYPSLSFFISFFLFLFLFLYLPIFLALYLLLLICLYTLFTMSAFCLTSKCLRTASFD